MKDGVTINIVTNFKSNQKIFRGSATPPKTVFKNKIFRNAATLLKFCQVAFDALTT